MSPTAGTGRGSALILRWQSPRGWTCRWAVVPRFAAEGSLCAAFPLPYGFLRRGGPERARASRRIQEQATLVGAVAEHEVEQDCFSGLSTVASELN